MDAAFSGPAAWTGAGLAGSQDWIVTLPTPFKALYGTVEAGAVWGGVPSLPGA